METRFFVFQRLSVVIERFNSVTNHHYDDDQDL